MLTYPKLTVHTILNNFSVRSRYSGTDQDINKIIGNKLDRLPSLPCWTKKLVNFGPLTNKLQARMLTHPKSTMRVLRMLLYLTSGHVTLLPGKFYPPELNPIGLAAPGDLTLGSASYF